MKRERSYNGLALLVIFAVALLAAGCQSDPAPSGAQAGAAPPSAEATAPEAPTATATVAPATPTLAGPPVTILLDSPPPGTQVGSPVLITGRTNPLPPDGQLGYSVRDSANTQVGSGSFPVTADSATGGGAFSAELTFTEPVTGGPISLLVFQIGPGGNAYGQVGLAMVVAPQAIWIDSPPPDTQVGSPVVISGRTAHIPATGNLAYRFVDAGGNPLGSGTIPLSPGAGSGGSFNASLEFTLPSTGGAIQVELLDQDLATGVVHARVGLSLAVSIGGSGQALGGQAAGGQEYPSLIPIMPSAIPTLSEAPAAPTPTTTTSASTPTATTVAPAPVAATATPTRAPNATPTLKSPSVTSAPSSATFTSVPPSATPTLKPPSATPVPPSATFTAVPPIITLTPSKMPTATPCIGFTCSGTDVLIDIPPGSPNANYFPCLQGPSSPYISVDSKTATPTPVATPGGTPTPIYVAYVGQRLYYFACKFTNSASLRAELSGPGGIQPLEVLSSESPLLEDLRTKLKWKYMSPTLKERVKGVVIWNALCDLPTGPYTLTVRSSADEVASLGIELKLLESPDGQRVASILSVPQAGPAGTTFTFYYCGYINRAGQDVVIDFHYLETEYTDGRREYRKSSEWIVPINESGWATSSLTSTQGDTARRYMLRDHEDDLHGLDEIRLLPPVDVTPTP